MPDPARRRSLATRPPRRGRERRAREALTADVGGATLVRLIVTDGGDGNNSDHADWADARITCT